jgi:hypothetical protein
MAEVKVWGNFNYKRKTWTLIYGRPSVNKRNFEKLIMDHQPLLKDQRHTGIGLVGNCQRTDEILPLWMMSEYAKDGL